MAECCSVQWCNRVHYARGLCHGHWQRSRRGVDLDLPWKVRYRPGQSCKAEGCDRTGPLSLGFCHLHYVRFSRHGDPHTVITRSSIRGVPEHIPHGTPSGYTYHRCRCARCRDYKRSDTQNRRFRDPDLESARRRQRYEQTRDQTLYVNRLWARRNSSHFAMLKENNRRRYKESTSNGWRQFARWSPTEDQTALRDDLTILELAHLLNRSYHAVTGRRYYLRAQIEAGAIG